MTMTKRVSSVKALQSHLNANKKEGVMPLFEYEASCQTNSKRGHVYDQTEIMSMFPRTSIDNTFISVGASKCTYTGYNGIEFENIVVKRSSWDAWTGRGNQLVLEIKTWVKFQDEEESDFLAPILKYFTSKSDRVTERSETMVNNVIIISQKAVYVGTAWSCVHEAERLNNLNGLQGENAEERYKALEKFTINNGWYDTLDNGGNSGVIYDYYKHCYKAVFIDYAL